MKILGIENRTENWKTAYYFSPFFRDEDARLALAKRFGEPSETQPNEVSIELYWKGMRDHLYKPKRGYYKVAEEMCKKPFAQRYNSLFPGLRDDVKDFQDQGSQFKNLKDWNYDASNADRMVKLFRNLFGTEIDIVLETPKHLFIGEAKHEMPFGAKGEYVLVHQLIRQYVMAKILVDRLECDKKVVPFVVGDNIDGIRNFEQVKFMLRQGWLSEESILSWDEIEELHP